MANITFSSPVMAKDVTVYAIAGHRGTILAIAKANKIPIPFDCQDGECGSCLIEVKNLTPERKHGIALTEKEKEPDTGLFSLRIYLQVSYFTRSISFSVTGRT